jgi:hypothetical protein
MKSDALVFDIVYGENYLSASFFFGEEAAGNAKSDTTAKLFVTQIHRDLCIANPFGQQMSLQTHLQALRPWYCRQLQVFKGHTHPQLGYSDHSFSCLQGQSALLYMHSHLQDFQL